MSQALEMGVRGLWLNPNPFSDVPRGSLEKADNMVIDRPGQADSRRGFKQFNDVIDGADAIYDYRGTLFLHADDTLYVDDGMGTWDALSGDFVAASALVHLRAQDMNRNLYLATEDGIRVLDAPDATSAYRAGSPGALDVTAELSGGSGWLPDQTQAAYRIVWGRIDANTNLVLGAPSARAIVINNSGSDDTVDLEFTIPSDITVEDFYQIYRSFPSAGVDIEPDDELQLVYQKNPTSGEISTGVISFTDAAEIDQMGASLYTDPSQEGIGASNNRPPFAVDMCEFQQFMFYANTKRPQFLALTLQSNYTVGKTVDIGALTYTAAASENIAAQEFEVGATVPLTLASLIRVINRDPANTLYYAYPIDELSFYIEGREDTTAQFTVDTNEQNFNRELPLNSDNDAHINGVNISKNRQPEACPFSYNLRIGSADKAILRILKTREAVIVLKEDGVYRITGTDVSNFAVDEIDNTTHIRGANTAVTFDDAVVCMTDDGVARISINGITLISNAIQQALLALGRLSNFGELASAVSYHSDQKYFLAVPSIEDDEENTQIFVYNSQTKSWTRWLNPFTAGLIYSETDTMFLVYPDGQVAQERKDLTFTDYADFEYTVDITVVSGADITVTSVPSGVVEGMTLVQSGFEARILDINANVLTVEFDNLPWSLGAATILQPIVNRVKWLQQAMGNPGLLKHNQEMTFVFRDAAFRELLLSVETNFSSGSRSVTLTGRSDGDWGGFEWGMVPWGGVPGGFTPIRTYFPKETQRSHWYTLELEIEQAFTNMSLLGVSVIATAMSPRFKS